MQHRMSEADLEKAVKQAADELGVVWLKFTPVGQRGYPDRILIAPGGATGFLELKRTGATPSKLQERRIDELHALGHKAAWTDTLTGAIAFIKSCLPVVVTPR